MNTIIFLIGVAALIVVNSLLAFVLGWLFTEVFPLPLKFKPFSCRPCLTFWLNVLLGVSLALLITPYFPGSDNPDICTVIRFGLIGVGMLMGLICFLYIKLKFRIYE